MKLITFFAAAAIGIASATTAHATMPPLTAEPQPATPDACRAWAERQSEDAIQMWGQSEDGTWLREIAFQRLTDICLGKEPPEIVFFGSSAGFDATYCQKHPKQKICVDHAKASAVERQLSQCMAAARTKHGSQSNWGDAPKRSVGACMEAAGFFLGYDDCAAPDAVLYPSCWFASEAEAEASGESR
jgi:hypothetical protein